MTAIFFQRLWIPYVCAEFACAFLSLLMYILLAYGREAHKRATSQSFIGWRIKWMDGWMDDELHGCVIVCVWMHA